MIFHKKDDWVVITIGGAEFFTIFNDAAFRLQVSKRRKAMN